ncbi:hypothetical protein ACFLT1_02650 [Bacteroidota bacterium]
MKKRSYFITIITITLFIFSLNSCGPDVEQQRNEIIREAYFKVVSYAVENGTNFSNGCQIGNTSGDAQLTFGSSTVKVKYTIKTWANNFAPQTATEIGDLTSFRIASDCGFQDCSNYYNVSIRGRWESREAGSGDIVLAISKTNELVVYIFGDGNWQYYSVMTIPDTKLIIETINSAKEKLAEL